MEQKPKEILIYNEITTKSISDLIKQLQDAEGADLKVRINSVGGCVDTGFMMYNELRRYAKENKAKITTIADGTCASIATAIFLAGDKRIINEHQQPFVHDAWLETWGNSKELMKSAQLTEQASDRIAKHYASHTNMSYKQAREFMAGDTYFTPEQCVSLRFAHEIERVSKPLNKFKTNTMKRTKASVLARLANSILGVKALIVYTASSQELDFYELEEGVTPQVGDKAKVDGAPAADAFEDGKVILQNGEVYVFVGEELTEIIAAESVEEELTPDELEEVLEEAGQAMARLRNSLDRAKKENAELKAKLDSHSKLQASFKGVGKTVTAPTANAKKQTSDLGSAFMNLKRK